ncbi:hypothetical protein ABIB57_000020 [Devosia sp. UYZn731]|uniref:pentapeptide repeat-containing protein n=1 Tax=Devosia sp. UYZn731 TaxID=3156345 RepID=UPI003397CA4A
MADEEDLKLLKGGSKDLTRCDFREADLSSMDLSNCDFSHALLDNSIAIGTNFSGCKFLNTSITSMNANGANLSGTNITSSPSIYSDFSNADFRSATTTEWHIISSKFINANLIGANLSGATFMVDNEFDGAIVDENTKFDDATIMRPLSRHPTFRYYDFVQGKLVRKTSEGQFSPEFAGAEQPSNNIGGFDRMEDDGIYSVDEPLPDVTLFIDENVVDDEEELPAGQSYITDEIGNFLTTESDEKLVAKVEIGPAVDPVPPVQLAFDLYAPYKPDDLAQAASDARRRLEQLLAASADIADVHGGAGHNQPPPELVTDLTVQQKAFEAFDLIGALNASDRANREALLEAGILLRSAAGRVGQWALTKLDTATDSFAGEVGAIAARAAPVVLGWYLFSGDVHRLVSMLEKLLGQ